MTNLFDTGSFVGRWVFALILVFATYNPSGFSYVSWLLDADTQFGPVPAMVGLVLLIGWIIYLRATMLSLGWLGIGLGAALFVCLVWLLVDLGWLSLETGGALDWLLLLMISVLLGVGISWSHIRRRLTGQIDMDDLEDGRG